MIIATSFDMVSNHNEFGKEYQPLDYHTYKRSVGCEPAASMPMAASFDPHDLTCVLLTCVDLHDLRFTLADFKTMFLQHFHS